MQVLLLIADYANVTADGKLNVMGIFNQVNAYQFPARHSTMYAVVKIIADIGETSEPRQFLLKVLGEDMEELGSAPGVFQFPTARAGAKPEANIIIPIVDLVFPQPGTYEVAVLVDGHNVADRPILVNQLMHEED